VAAFYKSECAVTVNVLAEISMDRNSSVRMRCCQMLSFILTSLPNRHDFHQLILPYILTLHCDSCPEIQIIALSTVMICGRQYETEHPDDIIERHQFGIDGDVRCNHLDPLPLPFQSRPLLGARLFVRENSRNMLDGLIKELSNWIEKVRLASSQLLKVVIIYNEEHITLNIHNTLEGLTKAIQRCQREKVDESNPLVRSVYENMKLIGRYVDPEVYLNLLQPRIVGDVASGTSFCDGGFHPEASRMTYTIALGMLIEGSSPNRISPHTGQIIAILLSETAIGALSGFRVQAECLSVLVKTINRFHALGINIFVNQYDAGGYTLPIISLNEITNRLLPLVDNYDDEQHSFLQTMVQRVIQEIEDAVQTQKEIRH
jgi:hypothetical protein